MNLAAEGQVLLNAILEAPDASARRDAEQKLAEWLRSLHRGRGEGRDVRMQQVPRGDQ